MAGCVMSEFIYVDDTVAAAKLGTVGTWQKSQSLATLPHRFCSRSSCIVCEIDLVSTRLAAAMVVNREPKTLRQTVPRGAREENARRLALLVPSAVPADLAATRTEAGAADTNMMRDTLHSIIRSTLVTVIYGALPNP